jgi:hypothetical protein
MLVVMVGDTVQYRYISFQEMAKIDDDDVTFPRLAVENSLQHRTTESSGLLRTDRHNVVVVARLNI